MQLNIYTELLLSSFWNNGGYMSKYLNSLIAGVLIGSSLLIPTEAVAEYTGQQKQAYEHILKTVEKAQSAEADPFSPEFLLAGALAEGLDELIDKYPHLNPPVINGFHYLGLHTFASNAALLREQGYLPEDFTEGRVYSRESNINERSERVQSGNFKKLEDALLAFTAEYSWRRDIFFEDTKELGINKEFTQSEVDFWTYAYYISGEGTARNMLKYYNKKGVLENEDYLHKQPAAYKQVYQLVKRRMDLAEKLSEEVLAFQ